MRKTRLIRIARLACLLLLSANFCGAEDIKKIHPSGYVTDLAGVIAPEAQARLEALCTEVEQKTGAQMAIVTVTSLEGESVDNYAVDLFKQLGVGGKKDNRGVLLLVAPNERKYRIEVGYGLEPVINDARAGDAGRAMVPYLRQGNYGSAIEVAARQLAEYIADDSKVTLNSQPPEAPIRDHGGGIGGLALVFAVIVFIVVIGSLISRGSGGGSGCLWFLLGMFLGNSGGGSSSGSWGGGGFGGGGGGFGGFGGGGSGGGGASGGW